MKILSAVAFCISLVGCAVKASQPATEAERVRSYHELSAEIKDAQRKVEVLMEHWPCASKQFKLDAMGDPFCVIEPPKPNEKK